jgi:hypothetical protein
MDLSETAGPRPWLLYSLKILILIILCITVFLFGKIFPLLLRQDSIIIFLRCLVPIALLMTVYVFAISVLPQPIKRIFMRINQLILQGAARMAVWLGQTFKELFSLLLNW